MEMFGQVDLRATCPPDKQKFFVISSPALAIGPSLISRSEVKGQGHEGGNEV